MVLFIETIPKAKALSFPFDSKERRNTQKNNEWNLDSFILLRSTSHVHGSFFILHQHPLFLTLSKTSSKNRVGYNLSCWLLAGTYFSCTCLSLYWYTQNPLLIIFPSKADKPHLLIIFILFLNQLLNSSPSDFICSLFFSSRIISSLSIPLNQVLSCKGPFLCIASLEREGVEEEELS